MANGKLTGGVALASAGALYADWSPVLAVLGATVCCRLRGGKHLAYLSQKSIPVGKAPAEARYRRLSGEKSI